MINNSNSTGHSNFKKIILTVVGLLGLIMILVFSRSLGEDVPTDQIVINQYPYTGTLAFWVEPGFQWQLLGTTTPYNKSFQYWFSADATKGGTGVDNSQEIIFNDAGKGWLSGSVRIQMPRSEKYLRPIQEDFGSMEAVKKDLVQETIDKVIFATGPLMSSYESYAIKKNDLINFIEDQLKYGVYTTNIIEETTTDPLTQEKKTVRIAERIPSEEPGHFGWQRQEVAPFLEYGLKVATVSVDGIQYEERIVTQIEDQQNARMQVQTAIAEAQEAEQNAKKAEAVGRQKIAEARAEQAVIKEKAVVEAEKLRDVAALEKEQAEFYKQSRILRAEGDASYKRQIMQADGALSLRLDAYKYSVDRWATAIENYQGAWVPQMVMGQGGDSQSGGSNGATQLINLLMAKTANDLQLDLTNTGQ